MDGGAWWPAVHGVAKSRTQLSDFTSTFHFHTLEKEMATHSSVLAWRIPGTEEPGGLPSMGSHRVRHDWSDLAAAAAYFRRASGPSPLGQSQKNSWLQGVPFIKPFQISLDPHSHPVEKVFWSPFYRWGNRSFERNSNLQEVHSQECQILASGLLTLLGPTAWVPGCNRGCALPSKEVPPPKQHPQISFPQNPRLTPRIVKPRLSWTVESGRIPCSHSLASTVPSTFPWAVWLLNTSLAHPELKRTIC